MKPKVSILIPAYNCQQWLGETIESALAQTWQNLEIIIVDDGSKDNTLRIAKQYESEKVKVIHQENQGQSAAENRAYQAAQGEFIQYLDADDLLAADKIERQMQLFQTESDREFVAACEWARFYQSPQDALFIQQPLWADLSPIDWLVLAWENHLMMHGAAWLIPRKITERAGFWNEELSLINDFDYFSRILLASRGVKFCWGAKTYYRSGNTGSLSGSKSPAAWRSALKSLEIGTSNLLKSEDSPRTRKACAVQFQNFIYATYPDVPELRAKAETQVKQLGGCDLKPPGGPLFQLLSSLMGWQRAKQLQQWVYRHGYQKAAWGWKINRWRKQLSQRASRV